MICELIKDYPDKTFSVEGTVWYSVIDTTSPFSHQFFTILFHDRCSVLSPNLVSFKFFNPKSREGRCFVRVSRDTVPEKLYKIINGRLPGLGQPFRHLCPPKKMSCWVFLALD